MNTRLLPLAGFVLLVALLGFGISWMRNNADGFGSATQLAEAANAALELPPGAMDDETHWVWEEALAALYSDETEKISA